MLQDIKSLFLIQHGWREVMSDGTVTCWLSPPVCCQTPLYFALDDAYALETVGEGIHAYAAQQALIETLQAEDARLEDEKEARAFQLVQNNGKNPLPIL
jgi:hypothetical protein